MLPLSICAPLRQVFHVPPPMSVKFKSPAVAAQHETSTRATSANFLFSLPFPLSFREECSEHVLVLHERVVCVEQF